MKITQSLILLISTLSLSNAFTNPSSSSFTGKVTSVCSREELSTGYSCVSSSSSLNKHRGRNFGMPPFLKKLGLKKPGSNEEEDNGNTAVLVKEEESTKAVEAGSTSNEVTNSDEDEKELSESEKLLKKVKEAGTAGIISYALWELAFWALSVPVCVFTYYQLVGHMPDFSNGEDMSKLGGEAFAFVNFARFAVPLRIGLALSTTGWIQDNIVDKFQKDDAEE